MQYHKLGASDMNLSALSIGTWAIGGANWGETDRTSSIRAMHAMFDHGVNSVDTAPPIISGSRSALWERPSGADGIKFI